MSLALRAENHLNGCVNLRAFRHLQRAKARGEMVERKYIMRPGYLAKWVEI